MASAERGTSSRLLRRLAGVAMVVLLIGAACILVWRGTRSSRVVVLGVDGLHGPLLDELVAQGALPNFGRIYREGCVGSVSTYDIGLPPLSPIIWTSFATGVPPEIHGIRNFTAQTSVKGEEPRLASSNDRRSAAVWEIASEAGKRVGVVNWLVTYPAEPVNGFVITERYVPVSQSALAKMVGAKLDRDAHRLFYPLELTTTLAKVPIGQVARLPLTPAETQTVDREIFHLAYAALERYPVDLLMIYTRSVDEYSHLVWNTHERLPGDRPGPDLIVDMLQRYDVLLGELMAHLRRGDRLMVLSDHGMERNHGPGLSGQHASKEVAVGVFLLWGAGIRAGVRLPRASMFDVLPTILEMLGVPAAANMRGQVQTAAFEGDRPLLPRRPTPYARRLGGTDHAESPADQTIVERLRALGYVQ
jgi:hypothetical protein